MKQLMKRLLALNLALLILLTVLPAAGAAEPEQQEPKVLMEAPMETVPPSQTAAPSEAVLSGGSNFWLSAGGQSFRSGQPASGRGWSYQLQYNNSGYPLPTLSLSSSYTGEPISASGDLLIYLNGNVTINAPTADRWAHGGIVADGWLEIYAKNGISRISGGGVRDWSGSYSAGDGIVANQYIWLEVINGSLSVNGGSNNGGVAGDGIRCTGRAQGDNRGWIRADLHPNNSRADLYVSGGSSQSGSGGDGFDSQSYTTINTVPYNAWSPYGVPFFDAAYFEKGQVHISGGRGSRGGCGISAGSAYLSADGTIIGGANNTGSYTRAGSAVEALSYYAGAFYGGDQNLNREISLNLQLKAGDSWMHAARKYKTDGSWPSKLLVNLGPHTELDPITSPATCCNLRFYPKSYQITLDPNGGRLSNSGTRTVGHRESLPLNQYSLDSNQRLLGYWGRADVMYRPDGNLHPWCDETLTAQWARDDETVFIADNTRIIGGGRSASYPVGQTFTVPSCEPNEMALMGWCTGDPLRIDRNETTKELAEDAVWLAPGDVVQQDTGRVFHSEYMGNPQFSTIWYHGNGGTKANGSTLAVKNTLDQDPAATLVVGGDMGFQRPGYRFDHWEDENGRRYNADTKVNNNHSVNLYAVWKSTKDPNKIYFEDETNGTSVSFNRNQTFTVPDTSFSQFAFWGWANARPETVRINSQTAVAGEGLFWAAPGDRLSRSSGETFYAIYGPTGSPSIHYHGSGGRKSDGSAYTVRVTTSPSATLQVGGNQGFTRDGYTFCGWEDQWKNPVEASRSVRGETHMDVYAVWEPVKDADHVYFIDRDGTVEGSDYTTRPVGQTITVPTAQAGNMLLWGWSTGKPIAIEANDNHEMGAEFRWALPGQALTMDRSETYYAIYVGNPNFPTIWYDGNGGTKANGSPAAVRCYRSIGGDAMLQAGGNLGFARPGYTFQGWEDRNGNPVSAQKTVYVGQNLYLKARWKADKDPDKIYFDDEKNGTSVSFARNETFTVPTASYAGEPVMAWCRTDTPNGLTVDPQTRELGAGCLWVLPGDQLTQSSGHTFYAKYAGDLSGLVIQYQGNGGVRADGSTTVIRCGEDSLVVGGDWGFVKDGYTLIGWKDEHGWTYSPDQTVSGKEVIKLKAIWQKNNVDVSFQTWLRPDTTKTMAALYRGGQLLTVLENGCSLDVEIPRELYNRCDSLALFQMGSYNHPTAPAARKSK